MKSWDELKAEAESSANADYNNLTGKIVKITPATAGEIYGDSAKDPDREVISVKVEIEQTGDSFNETYTLPLTALSWRNKAFKLGLFRHKYGKLPEVGQAVNVELGSTGFFCIAV